MSAMSAMNSMQPAMVSRAESKMLSVFPRILFESHKLHKEIPNEAAHTKVKSRFFFDEGSNSLKHF